MELVIKPGRWGRWSAALLYTALIYSLAFFIRALWDWLTQVLGTEGATVFVDRGAPALGLAAAALFLLVLRETRLRAYLWFGVALGGFAYLVTLHCEYPIERIHVLQYSLLAWLYFRALRVDAPPRWAYAGAALAVLFVGCTDELLQYFIPKRTCSLADMITNWCAGGLGLVGLLALDRSGLWPWYARRGGGVRIVAGYLAPLLLIAAFSHQVWTRYLHPPLNLIIITVDCCRPDRLGCYGYERDTSDYLDAIAAQGVVFENVYSQAAWTGPGVLSTLTGLYPPTHGVNRGGATLPKSVDTLLDLFAARGYRVPNMSYLTEVPNFENLGANEKPAMDFGDSNIHNEVDALKRWIGTNYRDPFAIWYHYRFLHLPYAPEAHHRVYPPANDPDAVPPPEISGIVSKEVIIPRGTVDFSEEAKAWTDALFDAQIREFDGKFESIRFQLKFKHISDNTLIVITADHGEELFEHGYIGHASTAVHSKHYDEHLRIPLIMYCPRVLPKGRRVEVMAQQVDIVPTILDLMGWEHPEGLQGRSLLPAIQGQPMEEVPVFAESIEGGYQSKENMRDSWVRSVRTLDWKLISRSSPEKEEFELYDLKNDPGEQINVFGQNQEIGGQLISALVGWLSTANSGRARILEREARLDKGDPEPPPPESLETPRILSPAQDAVIAYEDVNGTVKVQWSGRADATYLLQYHVGEGWHTLKNTLSILGTEKEFGPLPRDAWKPLYQWNPFRMRVRPRDLPDAWSDWVIVNIAPLAE